MLNLIASQRTSDRGIDRKTDLLLQAVDPAAGGYLPGYLTVKRLYLSCIREGALLLLAEPDLFLFYLTRYIYADPVLAAALVNPAASVLEALKTFAERLVARLWLLPTILTNESLAELQRASLANDLAGMEHAIGITEDEVAASAPALSSFSDGLQAADDDPDNLFGALIRALVFQRKYLYLGALRAHVRFEEGRAKIEVPGAAVGIEVPVFRTREPGDADTVHLIAPVQANGKWSVAAVYEKGEQVLAVSWALWDPDDREDLTDALLDQRFSVVKTRAIVESCQQLVARTLGRTGDNRYLTELMAELRATIHNLYLPLALAAQPGSSFAAVESRMNWGLPGLLQKRATVRRFQAASGFC